MPPLHRSLALLMSARRWLVLAAALALSIAAASAYFRTVFPPGGGVYFVDADCYARMTRVREVCAHPGEIIRHHTFENYPFGTDPHTTVPLDYAIWLVRGLCTTFHVHHPLDVAGAWISPLFGAAAVLGLWIWTTREGLHEGWLMLLVVAASPIVAHGFELGRPDHQSLIMTCMAWALAAEWAQCRAPSRGWGLVSGAAWALGLWTSLYEPVILLAIVLLAALIWNRPALFQRERVPGVALGGGILLVALWLEGWRIDAPPGFGEKGGAEYFAAWSRQIGELASVPPWSPTLYHWTGLGLLATPVLLCCVPAAKRPVARAHLLLVVSVFALTCWQVRWGYFLPVVYAMSLPWQFAAIPERWRTAAAALLLIGLFPMATEWSARLFPTNAVIAASEERRAEATALREVAAEIRRSVEESPAPPDSVPTDDGVPDAGILAPWWQSPALAYWSGEPALAGSSHESLPGTVDAARFYLSGDLREVVTILRRRRVRWVVAYEPERILQTAAPLLDLPVPPHAMADALYRQADRAPRFLRVALANQYFKVYEVRSALLPRLP